VDENIATSLNSPHDNIIYIYNCVGNGNCVGTNIFNTNVLTAALIETPSVTRNRLHVTSILVQSDIENKCNVLKALHPSVERETVKSFFCVLGIMNCGYYS
jgi:hypothetical protein